MNASALGTHSDTAPAAWNLDEIFDVLFTPDAETVLLGEQRHQEPQGVHVPTVPFQVSDDGRFMAAPKTCGIQYPKPALAMTIQANLMHSVPVHNANEQIHELKNSMPEMAPAPKKRKSSSAKCESKSEKKKDERR
jgi:hypothetical protein